MKSDVKIASNFEHKGSPQWVASCNGMAWNEPFGWREGTEVRKRDTQCLRIEDRQKVLQPGLLRGSVEHRLNFRLRQVSLSSNLFTMCIMRSTFIVTVHLCQHRTAVRLPMILCLCWGPSYGWGWRGKLNLAKKSNLVTSNVKPGLWRRSEYATP